MSHPTVLAGGTNNFLIPNGTIFFELLLFLVVLWILAKKIVPRISEAIEQRQETIRKQFEDAKSAKQRLEAAEREYQTALAETRRESRSCCRCATRSASSR
jgi:F-type H+-transporting ATPase subunit b